MASGAVSVSSPAARAIPPPGRGAQTAPAWACTHKIAIGDNDLIESALAHFAELKLDILGGPRMPLPDILGRLGLRLDPGRPALSVAFVGSDATAVNMPPRP